MSGKCVHLFLTLLTLVSLATVIKCARKKRDKHDLKFKDCGKCYTI